MEKALGVRFGRRFVRARVPQPYLHARTPARRGLLGRFSCLDGFSPAGFQNVSAQGFQDLDEGAFLFVGGVDVCQKGGVLRGEQWRRVRYAIALAVGTIVSSLARGTQDRARFGHRLSRVDRGGHSGGPQGGHGSNTMTCRKHRRNHGCAGARTTRARLIAVHARNAACIRASGR